MIQALAAAGLASLLLAAQPTSATPSPKPAAKAEPQGLKPGERREKVVCRNEAPAGTRVAKRVCMTLADRERQQEEAIQGFDEMQQQINTTYSRGN